MISKILDKIIYFILLAITFTPIIYQKKLFFPFESEKGFFFRFLIEIAFALWLILILIEPKFRPQKTPINQFLLVITLILVIADILGVDPFISFFSNFERMAGLIMYISVFAYFLVVSTIVNTTKRWIILFGFIIFNLLIVSIIGIYHRNDLELSELNGGRAISTIGNPIALALYLSSGFFIILFAMSTSFVNVSSNVFLKIIYIFGISITLLLTITLILTGSRGVIIGLGFSFLIMFIYFLRSKTFLIERKYVLIFIIFFSILGGSIAYIFTHKTNDHSLNRIFSLTDSTETNTFSSRLENYKVAINGIKEKPFLGWGQETFQYVYAKHYNPALYDDAPWYDRVHNSILEWLINCGIIGLIAYLGLWGAIFYQVFKFENTLSKIDKGIILGFLITYFIGIFTYFDTLTSLYMFFTIIAYVENKSRILLKNNKEGNKMYLLISLVMIAFGLITLEKITVFDFLKTNKSIVKAYNSSSLEELVENYNDAYNGAYLGRQEVAEQFTNIANDVLSSNASEQVKKNYFETAENIIDKELFHHPNYARLLNLKGNLLELQGKNEQAIEVFKKMEVLAPTRQQNLMQLGLLYGKNRQFDSSIKILKRTIGLENKNDLAKHYLALVYAMKGDTLNRNKINSSLSFAFANENLEKIKYSFDLTSNTNSFLSFCYEKFVLKGNINTFEKNYKIYAVEAYRIKSFRDAGLAVYAFRRHFFGDGTFKDKRIYDELRSEVEFGKNPEFAFERSE